MCLNTQNIANSHYGLDSGYMWARGVRSGSYPLRNRVIMQLVNAKRLLGKVFRETSANVTPFLSRSWSGSRFASMSRWGAR